MSNMNFTPDEIPKMADIAFSGAGDIDPWDVVDLIVADILDNVDLALQNDDVSAEIRTRANDYANEYYGRNYR